MKENFSDINTDLLVKYVIGEASANEGLLVERWLEADISNRRYYDHLRLIWDESRQLSPSLQTDEHAAWQRFRSKISGSTPTKKVESSVRLSWTRIAAALILVIASASFVLYLSNNIAVQQLAVRSHQDIINDTLPDGSVVTLNKHSSLVYPEKFSGATRIVSLSGEAFFNVSPDKSRPFIIQTNGIEVKVLGTSFNIKNNQGNTEVIVETGVVEVIKKSVSVRLMPKEKVTTRKNESRLVKESVTDKLYRYYRSKKFVCEATPLYKLVETLNEAYDANVVIGRNELRTLPLTTIFDNESLENILAVISHTFAIDVTRKGNQIILH